MFSNNYKKSCANKTYHTLNTRSCSGVDVISYCQMEDGRWREFCRRAVCLCGNKRFNPSQCAYSEGETIVFLTLLKMPDVDTTYSVALSYTFGIITILFCVIIKFVKL